MLNIYIYLFFFFLKKGPGSAPQWGGCGISWFQVIQAPARIIKVGCNDHLGKKVCLKCRAADTSRDLMKLTTAQPGTHWNKVILKKWFMGPCVSGRLWDPWWNELGSFITSWAEFLLPAPFSSPSFNSHTSMNVCFWKLMLIKTYRGWTSLVVQWLRICLPMQGTQVWSLVWEDPTCCGATKPVCHSYWSLCPTACAPQQEKPSQWEDCALQAESSPPCSPQVEKAWVEQWRVSKVKNK